MTNEKDTPRRTSLLADDHPAVTAAAAGETWTVGGREWGAGSWYGPKEGDGPPRRLSLLHLGVEPCAMWREVGDADDDRSHHVAALDVWLAWAGEEVAAPG